MKDRLYNWTKLVLENWKVILGIIAIFGSGVGNVFQVYEREAEIKDIEQKANASIAALATYRAPERPTPVRRESQTLINRIKRLEKYHP